MCWQLSETCIYYCVLCICTFLPALPIQICFTNQCVTYAGFTDVHTFSIFRIVTMQAM